MFYKKIRTLRKERKKLIDRLDSIYDTNADTDVIEYYKSELQCNISNIDDEIEFETKMLPINYSLLIFIIAVLCLFLFM
jgi:hypothetical protein